MLLASLMLAVSAGKPLGNVMIGNWTGTSKFSSGQEIQDSLNFIVRMGSSANYLQAEHNDDIIYINVSSTDLSGNITFGESTFYFNFSENLTHFVSTEINLEEYGTAYCSIASYQTLHCTHVSTKGDVSSLVFVKNVINANQPWFIRNYKFVLMIVAMGGMQFIYQFVIKKFSASSLFKDDKAVQKKVPTEESKAAPAEETPKKIKGE